MHLNAFEWRWKRENIDKIKTNRKRSMSRENAKVTVASIFVGALRKVPKRFGKRLEDREIQTMIWKQQSKQKGRNQSPTPTHPTTKEQCEVHCGIVKTCCHLLWLAVGWTFVEDSSRVGNVFTGTTGTMRRIVTKVILTTMMLMMMMTTRSRKRQRRRRRRSRRKD